MDRSTIAAIATPEGSGGIGIIKVSGPEAVPAAAAVFRRGSPFGNGPDPSSFCEQLKSWRLYYGHIREPATGRVLDEVVLAVMRAPLSYTREDVVEIQAHGGPRVLQRIMDLLVLHGVRPAGPGEFTRRAFVNGRIDLTQAEAVADLINAETDSALDMALCQAGGALRKRAEGLREVLVSTLSAFEAAIDFPDEAGPEVDLFVQAAVLRSRVLEPVSELIREYENRRYVREGLRFVIVGGPNAGKSSLMNRLLGRDRAIVTDVAGTTRDCIEASLVHRGVPVVLADTAGLRDDPDPVERIGIAKTREYLESADIILYVVDAACPARPEDLRLMAELSGRRVILVVNKADLPDVRKRFSMPAAWSHLCCVFVSALYGTGLEDLREQMALAAAGMDQPSGDSAFVPNWRHKVLLDRVFRAASDAVSGLEAHGACELAAIDLREALAALDEMTGRYVAPDVLDRIFSQYCIGK